MPFIFFVTHFFLPEVHEFGGLTTLKSGSTAETTLVTKLSTLVSIGFVSLCVTQMVSGLATSSLASSRAKQPVWSTVPLNLSIAFCVHVVSRGTPLRSAVTWHLRSFCAF